MLGLRANFGVYARILIQKMIGKSAFRQMRLDPDAVSFFAYRLGQFVLVDIPLQFVWRGSPEWWGLVAGAIQDAQRRMKTERLTAWPPDRWMATIHEVMEVHHAAYVVRSGWYFVHLLLLLSELYLDEEDSAGGRDVWWRARKKADAEYVLVLIPEIMMDVTW